MGYIERKYIVTEYGYFEDTEENLQAIKDGEFDNVVIDDYSNEDWYSLPGILVYGEDGNLIKSDNEGFHVIDNTGDKVYDTEWN